MPSRADRRWLGYGQSNIRATKAHDRAEKYRKTRGATVYGSLREEPPSGCRSHDQALGVEGAGGDGQAQNRGDESGALLHVDEVAAYLGVGAITI